MTLYVLGLRCGWTGSFFGQHLGSTAPSSSPRERFRRILIDAHVAAAIRLLARLREILHLKWGHVDFERGLLLLPDSKSGKKTIVLNAPALAILSDVPRIGTYVIAGQTAGLENEKTRSDLNSPWRRITRRSGLVGLRIHDLRHNHASIGAGAGLGLPIIGKLLGHAHPATTARYAHLDADPLRRASDQIGNQIATAMGDLKRRIVPRIVVRQLARSPAHIEKSTDL